MTKSETNQSKLINNEDQKGKVGNDINISEEKPKIARPKFTRPF